MLSTFKLYLCGAQKTMFCFLVVGTEKSAAIFGKQNRVQPMLKTKFKSCQLTKQTCCNRTHTLKGLTVTKLMRFYLKAKVMFTLYRTVKRNVPETVPDKASVHTRNATFGTISAPEQDFFAPVLKDGIPATKIL